jgi:hypothetical protein
MRKSLSVFMAFVAVLVAGCGLITEQSIYEGLRTQQSVKDAGTATPTEKMGTYDAYEKQRQQAKDPQ